MLTLKKPWYINVTWQLTPDEEIPETVCNENYHFCKLAAHK
jgi:hypothetical protein